MFVFPKSLGNGPVTIFYSGYYERSAAGLMFGQGPAGIPKSLLEVSKSVFLTMDACFRGKHGTSAITRPYLSQNLSCVQTVTTTVAVPGPIGSLRACYAAPFRWLSTPARHTRD